jgi:hypothetical protein
MDFPDVPVDARDIDFVAAEAARSATTQLRGQ